MMNYRFLIVLLVSAWLLAASNQSQADIYFHDEEIDEGRQWTYRLTVTPAAASTPLLKYRLLQPEVEKKSGNSVPFILKALNASKQAWRDHKAILMNRAEGRDATDLFEDIATRDLDKQAIRELVRALPFDNMLAEMREASYRSECDWQFNLRNLTGAEIVEFVLEDHQESRQLTRFVTMLACHQVANRDYEAALETIKLHTEFALDMSEPELLVCRLIGIAELNLMNQQVLRLMASPLSPNLYWPLTELPQPVVPMRDAIRFDLSVGLRSFPILIAPEEAEYDAARWKLELEKFRSEFTEFQKLFGDGNNAVRVAFHQLMGKEPLKDILPDAKQRLEELNLPNLDFESMPLEQIILVDAAFEHHRVLDEVTTWSTLPFPELVQHRCWTQTEGEIDSEDLNSYGALLAQLALPAMKAVRKAEARLNRDIAAMRVIEALRMHAAEAGRFPKTLDEVKCVPVPLNPSTSEPFVYRLDGKDATLELPYSDGHSLAKTFKLQLMGGGRE